MSTTNNMHSEDGWAAEFHQRGIHIWVTVTDGEGNDITFFFKDGDQADRVADAFNYRAPTDSGETE